MSRRLLTERFRFLLPIRLVQKQVFHKIAMRFDGNVYCNTFNKEPLPNLVFEYKSLLLRKLGDVDMQLQHNKVVNLKLAAKKLDAVLIKPGETFSFWGLVGNASSRNGYLKGLCLKNGEATSGVGGGMCQFGNLLFWMFLHTPMRLVERHHHSYDPFPDHERVVPFGTGASLMYNFIDLMVKNLTENTYQLHIYFDDEYIHGEILSNNEPAFCYNIFETDHHFVKKEDGIYRQNKVFRDTIRKNGGDIVTNELIMINDCLVKYDISLAEDKISTHI
jgi:vancomycin resistance protein VanW